MSSPILSTHFQSRAPSPIRLAQIKHMQRKDNVEAINVAIGNVSLPMHPAMQKRMFSLDSQGSPFKEGVVKYSATVGFEETNQAFLNILASSDVDTAGLYSQVTEGGSHAMELVIVGVCGGAGKNEKPLLMIDPGYTNYSSMAQRTGRKTISVTRNIGENKKFSIPDLEEIEKQIEEHNPGAILIIPYDNPTGHFYSMDDILEIAKLAVKHNLWLISDESYRELHYVEQETSTIWKLTNKDIEGVEGRRISIETASKVWNACGLRIGAMISDNKEFHEKSVAENTANLCPNVIGQYIFGALAHESKDDLQAWYTKQREYYFEIGKNLRDEFEELLPEVILSSPDASIYTVVDVKNVVNDSFKAQDFVLFCAEKGKVEINGKNLTLLLSPIGGFYNTKDHPGDTQMRIAFVEKPENMKLVPQLFKALFEEFINS